jgi:hypothetical protein
METHQSRMLYAEDVGGSGHAPTTPRTIEQTVYFSFVNFKMGNVLMLTLLSLIYTKEFWD